MSRDDARTRTPQLTHPRVHLNGTSREELMEQYTNAYRAIGDALLVLQQSAPNGRDYYVLGNGMLNRAEVEHASRMQRLLDVQSELLDIYEHLAG